MAKKGEKKSMKVFKTPKSVKISRRKPTYIAKSTPGPHSLKKSVPLTLILRDLLGIAENAREARVIVNEGRVRIDGKKVNNPRRPVGFMDVLSLPPISKHYRIVYDEKGKLTPKESGNPDFKLCRIQDKTQTKQGLQLNLHDGKTLLVKKKYETGGTLKLSLPQLKIKDYFPLKKGSVAYITGGKHAGGVGKIKEIMPGTQTRQSLAVLESEEKQFQTPKDYVFVLGTKKPAITLQEKKGENK